MTRNAGQIRRFGRIRRNPFHVNERSWLGSKLQIHANLRGLIRIRRHLENVFISPQAAKRKISAAARGPLLDQISAGITQIYHGVIQPLSSVLRKNTSGYGHSISGGLERREVLRKGVGGENQDTEQ